MHRFTCSEKKVLQNIKKSQKIMKVILDSRHQGQSIFLNFMTLLDLSHDPGENEALLVKIGARIPD